MFLLQQILSESECQKPNQLLVQLMTHYLHFLCTYYCSYHSLFCIRNIQIMLYKSDNFQCYSIHKLPHTLYILSNSYRNNLLHYKKHILSSIPYKICKFFNSVNSIPISKFDMLKPVSHTLSNTRSNNTHKIER